jgi:hypothetical protein
VVYDAWIKDYAYLKVRVTSQRGDGSGPPIKRVRYSEPFKSPFWLKKHPQQSLPTAVIGDEYEE